MIERPHRVALVRHLLAILAPFATMIAWPAVAPVAAVAVCVAAFILAHDLAHGALRLPRRHNERALAVAGVLMMTSGHAIRLIHLRHHADPLGVGDLEGNAARVSAARALVTAPRNYLEILVAGWRTATARDRAWQRREYAALAVLVALAAIGPRVLQIYVVAGVALQLLAPLWAGHLPHRLPAWLYAIAHPLARMGSITMATLVAHEAHHRSPRHPIHQLQRELCARPSSPGMIHVAMQPEPAPTRS